MCHHRKMTDDRHGPISITLSPAQVDAVVRAASHSRAPGLTSVIAGALRTPPHPGQGTPDGPSPAPDGANAPAGYMRVQDADPRLSRALMRGLSILTCFGADGGPRGVVELACELGMSPSTTHRYASTLVELGLLERCPRTRKYRLAGTPR
jgi:IclR helix-turn-helix domain